MAALSVAGMELILFKAACMVLCFGFVTKTALVTHQCFGYCPAVPAQHQHFLLFPYSAAQQRHQGGQEAGWGHSQDRWPKQSTGMLHTDHLLLSNRN